MPLKALFKMVLREKSVEMKNKGVNKRENKERKDILFMKTNRGWDLKRNIKFMVTKCHNII